MWPGQGLLELPARGRLCGCPPGSSLGVVGGGVFGQKDSGSGGQLEGTWEGSFMVPERTGALGWARAGVWQVRRKSEGPCSDPVRLSVLPPQSLLLL